MKGRKQRREKEGKGKKRKGTRKGRKRDDGKTSKAKIYMTHTAKKMIRQAKN